MLISVRAWHYVTSHNANISCGGKRDMSCGHFTLSTCATAGALTTGLPKKLRLVPSVCASHKLVIACALRSMKMMVTGYIRFRV